VDEVDRPDIVLAAELVNPVSDLIVQNWWNDKTRRRFPDRLKGQVSAGLCPLGGWAPLRLTFNL
jgi:hypothetical protein